MAGPNALALPGQGKEAKCCSSRITRRPKYLPCHKGALSSSPSLLVTSRIAMEGIFLLSQAHLLEDLTRPAFLPPRLPLTECGWITAGGRASGLFSAMYVPRQPWVMALGGCRPHLEQATIPTTHKALRPPSGYALCAKRCVWGGMC